MTYRLYVKGDEMRARAEAEGRGLLVLSTERDPGVLPGYAFVMVARDGKRTYQRVVDWFAERESKPKFRKSGYPAGTLLFYSELGNVEVTP